MAPSPSYDSALPPRLRATCGTSNFRHDWTNSGAWLDRITINQLTLRNCDVSEELEFVAQLGFGGVGLWRLKVEDFGEERLVDRLQESGLKVSTLSWLGPFTGSHGTSHKEAVEEGLDWIRLAGALGVDTVLCHAGAVRTHLRKHARRLVRWGLEEMADEAARCGVRLALLTSHPELGGGASFLQTLDEAMEVIDGVNHEAVGLALDTFAVSRERDLLRRLPELTPRIFSVSLSDSCLPFNELPDQCLPGEGRLPLAKLATTLLSSGYEGFFDVCVPSQELWHSDPSPLLKMTRRLLQRLFDHQLAQEAV